MFNQVTTWRTNYKEGVLNDSFRKLQFSERADGGWSIAHHTFTAVGNDHEKWIDEFAGVIGETNFTFNIQDTPGGVKLPSQNHIVLRSSLNRKTQCPRFEVVTIEKRALMLVRPSMKYYEGSLGSIVTQAISDAGLSSNKIEEPKNVEEFKVLHNPGWSSHRFVSDHITKRCIGSKGTGGFFLWSHRGDKVNFGTPETTFGDIRPDDYQVDDSDRVENYDLFIHSGGKTIGHAFDPLKFEPIVEQAEIPGRGSIDNFDQTMVNQLEAALSQDALKAFAGASGSYEAWTRNMAQVTLFGDRNCGIDLPLKMSLQRFKEVRGSIVVARTHTVKEGKYTCLHHCLQR